MRYCRCKSFDFNSIIQESIQSLNYLENKGNVEFEIQIDRFIKVFPRDYKLALSKQKVGIELNIK